MKGHERSAVDTQSLYAPSTVARQSRFLFLPDTLPIVRSLALAQGIAGAFIIWQNCGYQVSRRVIEQDGKEAAASFIWGMGTNDRNTCFHTFTDEYVRACQALLAYFARHPRIYRALASLIDQRNIELMPLVWGATDQFIENLSPDEPLPFSWELFLQAVPEPVSYERGGKDRHYLIY